MRNKIRKNALVVVAMTICLFMASGLLFAHHAHQVVANYETLVGVTGVVVKHEFVNPHALIHVEAKDEKGNTEEWIGYGGTPGMESRLGYSNHMFKIGEERITMYGFPNKDGRKFMIYMKMVRSNGEEIPIYQTMKNDYLEFLRQHDASTFKELSAKFLRYIGGTPYRANADK